MSDKGSIGVIVEKLSFFNKLSLLGEAVADTEEPTPGYMFNEICNISHESGAYCSDLLEYLVSQLSSRSYNVKYKVLKIMRCVVVNGNPDFKAGLRKQSLGITDAIQFSGPPHPSRGMEPYLKVRKEAAALSEVLFSEREPIPASDPSERPTQLQLGGMGSSNHQGLMGFGNTTVKPTSSFVTSVKEFAEKVLSPPQAVSRLDEANAKKFGEYQPASLVEHMAESGFDERSRSPTDVRSSMEQSRRKTAKKKHVGRRRGVAGGGWADPEEEELGGEEGDSSQLGYDLQAHSPERSKVNQDQRLVDTEELSERLQQVETAETSAEEILVDDVTMEIDTFIISHEQIKDFTKQCSMLNCDIILEKLTSKFKVQEEIVQMRALLVLEGLLRTDLVSADRVVSVCGGDLLSLQRAPHRDRRTAKTRKILRILEKLTNTNNLISQDELSSQSGSVIHAR